MLLADDRSDWPQRFAMARDREALERLLLAETGNRRPLIVLTMPDATTVGFVALDTEQGEIEYYIGSRYRRSGFAREAIASLLPVLARLSAQPRLKARTARSNRASLLLLAGLGFRFTGLEHDDNGGVLACFVSPPMTCKSLPRAPNQRHELCPELDPDKLARP